MSEILINNNSNNNKINKVNKKEISSYPIKSLCQNYALL